MISSSFEAASKAAEESLEFLITAEASAADGNQADAKRLLRAIRAFEILHSDTLREMELELAAVADGQVRKISPRGGDTLYHSSVHLAVNSLWSTITVLSHQPDFKVPPNLQDWLGVNTSQLRAGLIRERAKLLANNNQESPKGKQRKKPGRPSKKETDSDTKIIAALTLLLRTRGKDDPPTGRQIVKASGVDNVSRFIIKHFKSQKEFAAAWRRGVVAQKLVMLQYAPERHAQLRSDE